MPPVEGEKPGALDDEGITKLYADDPKASAQRWFLGSGGVLDSSNPRIGFKGTIKKLANGVHQFTPTSSTNPASARLYVGTTNSAWNNQQAQIAGGADWSKMLSHGYMIGPEDYRDAESPRITKSPKAQTTMK